MINMASIAWSLCLAAVWLLLTDGSLTSLIIGIPSIVLALLARPFSSQMIKSWENIEPSNLPAFLGRFVIDSVRGGVDVSRRVMSTKPSIDAAFFDYPIQLQSALARHLFVNSISLLPGTLCADWQGDNIRIHSLDRDPRAINSVRALEQSVARLFGAKL